MKRNNKITKTLSIASATTLMLSNLLPLFTYAESTTKDSIGSINMEDDGITIGVDKTQEQKTLYSEEIENEGSQGADVYVSQASTFGVFIPKVLILDGKKNDERINKANYVVSISETSNFAGQEKILVIPEKEFTLSQLGKDDIQATITQDKEEWLHNEIDVKGNGEVITNDLSAGSWKGIFYFNIELESNSAYNISLSEKNLFLGVGNSRQINATLNGKNINNTATWTSDNENITVNNGLIETKASAQVGDVATINVSIPIEEPTINEENLQAKGLSSLFVENVYANETKVATTSLTVEIIDIVFTIDDEKVTSINIAPGNQVNVKANIVPENNDGIVSWSTNAITGLNLIKNGNNVTLKVADDMPIGNEYFLLATSETYTKLLKVIIVEKNNEHNHKFEEYLKENSWAKTADGTSGFVQNEINGVLTNVWKNGNAYSNNSTATSTWTINLENETTYSIPYYVSGSNNDKLTITLDGTKIVNDASGEINKTYNAFLSAGTHTLVATFAKDGSGYGEFANITLENIVPKHKCTHCNLIENHNYTETIDIEKTCEKNGIKKFTCECGVYYTEEILAKHEYNMGICINCGEKHPDYDEPNLDIATPAEYFVFSLNEDQESYSIDYLTEAGQQLEEIIIPNYYNGKIVNAISNGGYSKYTDGSSLSKAFATNNGGTKVSYVVTNSKLKTIVIPNSINDIGYYAFAYCVNLNKIIIPNSMTEIKASVFAGCNSLTSIGPIGSGSSLELPSTITKIGQSAFVVCENLKKVELPEGVIELTEYTFQSCNNLLTVELPNTMTIVGRGSFFGCSNLKTVYVPKNVVYMGNTTLTNNVDGYLASRQAFSFTPSSLKIYCEMSSKPSTWNKYWHVYYFEEKNVNNNTNVPTNIKLLSGVYWGITREQYNSTYEYQVN